MAKVTSTAGRRRKRRSDAAPEPKVQLLVRLPPALVTDVKVHVARQGQGASISLFAEEAFRAALKLASST